METTEVDHPLGAIAGLLFQLADRGAGDFLAFRLVADAAIHSSVDPEIWGEAMVLLIEQVKAGRPGEGMALAVEKMGAVLAENLPRRHENPNELSDRLIEL